MKLEIKPGPILAVGSNLTGGYYLYQLNSTPGLMFTNLWGGSLSAQNGNNPVHLNRAVKLFLAAEDMLAALIAARDAWGDTEFPSAQVEAAIAKATE